MFRSGISPFEYMKAFDMALFLSADDADVREAVAEGFPAGCVLPLSDSGNRGDGTAAEATHVHESGEELRVAFDFDGVLAGDSAERVFREAQVSDPANALEKYNEHEADLANRPIEEGPLKRLLEGINILQNAAREYREANPAAQTPNLRVALVTARSGKAQKRAVNTLEDWGLTVDDAFFLGGLNKAPFLNRMQPDIFFDDQMGNLDRYTLSIPSVHIPFGAHNGE